jgi:hypothetical protein
MEHFTNLIKSMCLNFLKIFGNNTVYVFLWFCFSFFPFTSSEAVVQAAHRLYGVASKHVSGWGISFILCRRGKVEQRTCLVTFISYEVTYRSLRFGLVHTNSTQTCEVYDSSGFLQSLMHPDGTLSASAQFILNDKGQ